MPKRRRNGSSSRFVRRRTRTAHRLRSKRVSRSKTTYPNAIGGLLRPKQRCSFLYKDAARMLATATNPVIAQFNLNNPYDFDYSNLMTNKQPLGWDNLMNASMYRAYRVQSWVTTFTVINRGAYPLRVLYAQSNGVTDCNAVSEAMNWPGVVMKSIGPSTGLNKVTFTVPGNVRRICPEYRDQAAQGAAYSTGPAATATGNLILYDSAGNAIDVDVQVSHVFHTSISDIRVAQS